VSELVIDTSAAVAILRAEPEADGLLQAIDETSARLMSTPSFVELALVLEGRFGSPARGVAERFVTDGGVELVPFDPEQAQHALDGWRRFGKGRHPAALNLGDCFTYGLAVATGLPVLCVGRDFSQTDVDVVRP